MKRVKTQISKIKFFYYKVALVLTIAVMAATVFQLPQIFIHSANKDMKQVIKDVSSTETLVVENELSVKTTVLPLADNQLQVTLDVVSELPTTSLENDQFILLVDQSASMNEYQETYETAIEVFKQSVAEKSNKTAQIQEMYYNVANPELENEFSNLTEAMSSLSALFSEGDASKTHVLLVTDSVLNDEIPSTEVTVSEEEIQAKMPEVIEVPEIVVTEEQIQAKMPEVIEVPEVTISEGEEVDVEARQAELQQEAYDQAYTLATEAAKQETYNQSYEVAYQEAYQLATEQAKLEKSMTVNQEVYESMIQEFNQSLTELSELTKDSDLSILALPNKARESQVDYQTITQIEMTDLSELEAKLMEWVSTFEHTQTFNQFNLNYEVSSLFKIVENSLTSSVEGVTIDNSKVNINLQENIPTTMNLSFKVELINDETEINESVTLTKAANVSYQLGDGDLKTSDLPTTEVNIETIVTEISEGEMKDESVNTLLEDEDVDESIDGPLVDEAANIALGQDVPTVYSTISGTLTTTKTASKWENDQSTIEFNITGTPEGAQYTADIVLAIDLSNSMKEIVGTGKDQKTLLKIAKEAAIDFCEGLLTEKNKNFVRIAVVTYHNTGTIKQKFTNDLKTLKSTINNLQVADGNYWSGGGTNTQAGINMVAEALKPSKATNQYVLFFTDGLPTLYNKNGGVAGAGDRTTDTEIKKAQKEFYQHFLHYNKNLKQTTIGGIVRNNTNESISINGENVSCPNAKFYAVGLITKGESTNDFKYAKTFLSTIQNAVDPSNYKSITDNANSVNNIFKEVSQSIGSDMKATIATDAVLTDTIAKEFTIKEDSVKILNAANQEDLTQQYKDRIHITKSETNDTCDRIEIELGDIPKTGLVITFDIEARNKYLAGNELKTNGTATLEYTQNDEDKEYSYDSPTVDIEPKIGKIQVTKVVERESNASDRFSISMKGPETYTPETYTVDLGAGESQTLTFYMRDAQTPIELNTAYKDYNYLMIGDYTVSELLPANYELVSIDHQSFTIDKDHPNISITVTNKLVNENYWYDQVNKPNRFTYNKDQQNPSN